MRDDLEKILPTADLFLSASETESFGLSMLEAMSCGVPCVSTDVGGVAEVIGSTGDLVELAQPEQMAKAAIAILTNADRHARLAEAARQRAIDCFSTDRIVAQYEAIYERVLS